MQCQNETNKQGAHDCSVEFDPDGLTGMVETTNLKKNTMTHKKELASQNARVTQNLEETSNVEVFEIDIMEELKFEHEECEESELSKLLFNL